MQTEKYIIIHYGELGLKGRNQPFFRNKLAKNIRIQLKSLDLKWLIEQKRGYLGIIIDEKEFSLLPFVTEKLKLTNGIAWFAIATRLSISSTPEMVIDSIRDHIVKIAKEQFTPSRSFRVRVKRSDKDFPYNSPDIESKIGKAIIECTSWSKVDLENPDKEFFVEISYNEVFLFSEKIMGASGLPVGTSDRVLTLLSGGIDSPVSAYLIARRGCTVDFVHFSAMNMKPEQVISSKIGRLVRTLSEYLLQCSLYVLPYIHFNLAILGKNSEHELILFRRFMAKTAEKLAERIGAKALITGDNLSQVASQTLSNISTMYHAVSIPILQPLLTSDKYEIIKYAEKIGTYKLSTEPYKDCCSLISSKAKTASDRRKIENVEKEIIPDYASLIEKTLADMIHLKYNITARNVLLMHEKEYKELPHAS